MEGTKSNDQMRDENEKVHAEKVKCTINEKVVEEVKPSLNHEEQGPSKNSLESSNSKSDDPSRKSEKGTRF